MITLSYTVWIVGRNGKIDKVDGHIQVAFVEWSNSVAKRRIYREVHKRQPEAFAIRIEEVER